VPNRSVGWSRFVLRGTRIDITDVVAMLPADDATPQEPRLSHHRLKPAKSAEMTAPETFPFANRPAG